jgi:hypothetical protein
MAPRASRHGLRVPSQRDSSHAALEIRVDVPGAVSNQRPDLDVRDVLPAGATPGRQRLWRDPKAPGYIFRDQ